jgi:hypothetical protein
MPLNILTFLDEASIICVNINNVEMHHVKISEKEKVKGFTKIMKQLNRIVQLTINK